MCFHLQISCDPAPHIFFMMPWVKMSLLQSFELHGFPCGSVGREPTCNVGDLCSIPGLGRSPTGGKNYLLQYSGLENSTDCMVHGVAKGQTGLNNFHFHLASWQEESPREVTCDSSWSLISVQCILHFLIFP